MYIIFALCFLAFSPMHSQKQKFTLEPIKTSSAPGYLNADKCVSSKNVTGM